MALHEWSETLEEVGLVLGKLSPEQLVIAIGCFLGGQSTEDVAQALGKQPGTVRMLQFRALQALAKQFGQMYTSEREDKGGRG